MKVDKYDTEFSKKYLNITDVEDYARVFKEVEIPSFIRHFKISVCSNAKTIADFGCGNGMYTRIIRKINDNYDIYGLDLSQDMLNEAIKKGPSSLKYFKGNIDIDMSNQLGIVEGFFDVAICNWVLSYSENVANMTMKLMNINKMMRKGGLFLGIITNCFLTPDDMPQHLPMVEADCNEEGLKQFKDEMKMKYTAYIDKVKNDGITFHDIYFTYDTLAKCFKESGFDYFEAIEMDIPKGKEYEGIRCYYGMIIKGIK